ncbi:Hypothetical protein KLENKIAIHU_80, partial [Klenkia terrae]|jgi:hypothetical protein
VTSFPLVRGWQVVPRPDRTSLDVLDATGRPRARVVGLRPRRTTPAGREVLQVLLPDGSATTLTNGTRWWGGRRARTRGLLPLAGHAYVLQHRTGRRARVLRDGAWIATARRDVPGPTIEVRTVLTPDDELACALLAHVLRPGRDSVLGNLAELLNGFP